MKTEKSSLFGFPDFSFFLQKIKHIRHILVLAVMDVPSETLKNWLLANRLMEYSVYGVRLNMIRLFEYKKKRVRLREYMMMDYSLCGVKLINMSRLFGRVEAYVEQNTREHYDSTSFYLIQFTFQSD